MSIQPHAEENDIECNLRDLGEVNVNFMVNLHDVAPHDFAHDVETQWLSLGNSVYGVAISTCIESELYVQLSSLCWTFILIFQQVIAVGGVQGFLLYSLYRKLPSLYDKKKSSFCSNDSNTLFFSVCVIDVFIFSLIPTLRSIFRQWTILRLAMIKFSYDRCGVAFVTKLERGLSLVAYTILTYELLVWISVLAVGVLYIITTEGVVNVILAAAALSIVNNIGSMAVPLYGDLAELVGKEKYRCEVYLSPSAATAINTLLNIPVLVASSCGIVYGLHSSYCH
eukprot:gene25365-33905_t